MLWIYTQGGWAPRPVALTANGCVLRPPAPRSFGFRRTLGALAAFSASLIALGWLWGVGHAVEVVGAVLAAVLIDSADRPFRALTFALSKYGKRLLRRGRRQVNGNG